MFVVVNDVRFGAHKSSAEDVGVREDEFAVGWGFFEGFVDAFQDNFVKRED